MCQFVLLEAGHLCKSLAAPLELAGIGPLPRVSPDVVLEVPRRGKGFRAICVGADKGPLPSVDPAVDVEVLRGVETLAAARELALAGPVRDVDLLDVRAQVSREGEGATAPRVVTLVWFILLDPSGTT